MNDKHIRILLAAKKVFESQGYHESKIADIAKLAEVGKGTVYEYFESKQVLFEQMIMFLIESGLKHTEELMSSTDDVIEKLHMISEVQADIIKNHGQLFNLILVRFESSSDALKTLFIKTRDQQLHVIESLIEEGISTGLFKPCNPKHFAVIFKGAMLQVHMGQACDKGHDEHLKDEIFKSLIASIKS